MSGCTLSHQCFLFSFNNPHYYRITKFLEENTGVCMSLHLPSASLVMLQCLRSTKSVKPVLSFSFQVPFERTNFSCLLKYFCLIDTVVCDVCFLSSSQLLAASHMIQQVRGHGSVSLWLWSLFFLCFFPLQDSLRGRPKEIPHNEKLLSLKYEVKSTTRRPESWLLDYSGDPGLHWAR